MPRDEPRPDLLVEHEQRQEPESELVAAAELVTEAVVEAIPELSAPVAEEVVDLDSLAADELVAALQQIPLVAIAAVVQTEQKAPAVAADQVREETPLAVEVKAPPAVAATPASAPAPAIAATPAPAPAPADAQPAAAKSEREWVALIESLRVDVERIRTKGGEKPAAPKKDEAKTTTKGDATKSGTATATDAKDEKKTEKK